MLTLTRKRHERIIIDGNIVIEVVSIDRGRVRIGVDAPHDVSIVRSELLLKQQEEPKSAT